MSLFRKRPHLHLRAPRGRAGAPFTVTIVIDADREVPIDALHVELAGEERAGLSVGFQMTQSATLELGGDGTMLPGRRSFDCRFDLPADLPPSYSGQDLTIEYHVSARLDIPWWPDARGQWLVEIDAAPRPPTGELPAVNAGGDVVGALPLTPLLAPRFSELAFLLVGEEHTPAGRHEIERYYYPPDPRPATPDGRIHFRLRIPAGAIPSFSAERGSFTWTVHPVFVQDASPAAPPMPLQIVAPAQTQRTVPAPRSSDPDVHELWASVAKGLNLLYADGRISGTIGATILTIYRTRRGRRILLHGQLAYPSLRLGLVIAPRQSPLPRWRGLRPDQHADDPLYFTNARERAQAEPLMRALIPHLTQLPQVAMSDEAMHFTCEDAGKNTLRLWEYATQLSSLAHALEAARVDLPLPAGAPSLHLWIGLAMELGGDLARGDLSITGHLRGVRVAVAPQWGQRPAMTLTVTPATPPPTQDGPLDPARLAPEAAAALARVAPESILPLRVAGGALHLDLWRIPPDPRTLMTRIHALIDLAALLGQGAGPYR